MSLETPASSELPSETVSTAESAVESSNSGSGYSAIDPGYDAGLDSLDELAELKAENTKKTPSETLDDASGEETTDETVETPADESVDSDDEISDELLDRALELGYTLDEMKAFTDAKALEKEVTRVERINQRMQAKQSGKQPSEKAAPVEEAKPEPDWDALIELGHDPDLIALQKQNWQEAQDAKAQVRQLLQAEQARAFEAQCNRFDDALNNIGDEFKTLLGTGRRGELLEASPAQAANRQAVFTKMNMLRSGYEQAGMKVPPEADLIQEAVHASFFKHAQQTARKKLTGDIKRAGSQALSRPKSGGSKPLSGPSLALQKEQDFWKAKGV